MLQQPILTAAECKELLEGIQPASLTRDELVHALEIFKFPVDDTDHDSDLVSYLAECLKG